MKDEIAEVDVQKALIKQLKEKDSFSVIRKKKKKAEESFKLKKRKSSDEKDDIRTLDKAEVPRKKHKANKTDNTGVQRPLRPPPKVVVFEEPGKSKEENREKNKVSSEKDNDVINYDDFMEIARDVKEFGMTGFSKKERRKYEQQKAQALGAKAPKGMKMPYKIYMAHVRVQKRKEEARQQLELAMGMTTKKNKNKKKDNKSSLGTTNGWWSDKSSKGLDMSIGKYKKGVQTLSRDDIKRIKATKGKK